jgi:hypothetical protein
MNPQEIQSAIEKINLAREHGFVMTQATLTDDSEKIASNLEAYRAQHNARTERLKQLHETILEGVK